MAARRSAPGLYDVFLARVINIEAVQCHREAVTDERMKRFFSEGRLPWSIGEWLWCLEAPTVPQLYMTPVSLPMQHARNAAISAFKELIAAIVNGELIASGVHPATGFRCNLDPAEWTRTDLILDVRNGDLFEAVTYRPSRLRWSAITLRAAVPEPQLGKRIDWDDWWKHEDDRRQQGLLPDKKAYLREAAALIKERYGVTAVSPSELRRLRAALYRGDPERPKRPKRKQPKLKG